MILLFSVFLLLICLYIIVFLFLLFCNIFALDLICSILFDITRTRFVSQSHLVFN